jgi:hypothetical protein
MHINNILSSYPRNKIELPPEYEKCYSAEINNGRAGKTIFNKAVLLLESWMHRMIAKKNSVGESLLEIGAGTLNHIKYEKNIGAYDAIEPFDYLNNHVTQTSFALLRSFYQDIEEIDPSNKYNRIVSIAVLEHLVNLPKIIAKSGLLLDEGGIFQAGIPCEGEFLWHFTSSLSSGLSFRLRTGLNYSTLMRYEHINSATEIIEICKYFFKNVRTKRFPIQLKNMSLYIYIEASNPILERCREFGSKNEY